MTVSVPLSSRSPRCVSLPPRIVVQIGVQHTDNAILKKISRGHGVEATIEALRLLKDNCFKARALSSFCICSPHLTSLRPTSTQLTSTQLNNRVLFYRTVGFMFPFFVVLKHTNGATAILRLESRRNTQPLQRAQQSTHYTPIPV